VSELPFGDQYGIQEFLDLGVAGLGVGQDFTNEVHWALDFMPLLPLYYYGGIDHLCGCCYVEQKQFPIGWGDNDRGLWQEFLELVKRVLSLERPCEPVNFL
jgi:hypothetical protein